MKLGIYDFFLFLYKSMYCDVSYFSESYQDYESAGLILFGESWIFANFVTKQPAEISTASCCLQHSVHHRWVGSTPTDWVLFLLGFVHRLYERLCPAKHVIDAAVVIVCVCGRGWGLGRGSGEGCPRPPVCNNIMTPCHLFSAECHCYGSLANE